MREFEAVAVIDAPPERVWAILTDAGSFPEWDPYCDKIEGTVAPGQTIRAFSKLSPGRAFPVRVAEFVPNAKMTWIGGMPLGLFKGVRTFTLADQGGRTRFAIREVFSGLLSPVINRTIPDMTDAFRQFAAGLKRRAESA